MTLPFSFEVEHRPDQVAVVHCHGSLEAGTTPALSAGIRPLFPDCRHVILDLSDLRHINSIGLGALAQLHVAAKSAGSSLELANLTPHVRHILEVTHLTAVFTVVDEN